MIDKRLRIFIVASERSGTNLLRTLLSNHTLLDGPIATHLAHIFFKAEKYYGDLSKKESIELLFQHFKTSVNHIYTNWNLNIDFKEFFDKYQSSTFFEVFDAVHIEKVGDGLSYVCKDKNLYDHAIKINEEIPNCKFIYLYRDPRDCVASNLKNPRSLWTVQDNAKAWRDEQKKCFEVIENLGDNVISISYEKLVSETSTSMKKILSYLDLEFEEGCAFVDGTKNDKNTWNQHWENLNKPVLKNNYNKYRESLNEKQINKIESICFTEMSKLDYSLDTQHNWKVNGMSNISNKIDHYIAKMKRWNYVKEKQKLSDDKNSLNQKLLNELDGWRSRNL